MTDNIDTSREARLRNAIIKESGGYWHPDKQMCANILSVIALTPLEHRANEEARHGNREALERGVVVKPLEWRGSYSVIRADTEFGSYQTSASGKILTLGIAPMSPQMVCANLADAKAKAQADYERRILSAITPSPRTDQETWEACKEAASAHASEWLDTETMKLRAGEMTAQEVRTVKAVIGSLVLSLSAIPYQPPEAE